MIISLGWPVVGWVRLLFVCACLFDVKFVSALCLLFNWLLLTFS